jgi:RNA polymerase sigma-70 factor, ECF subfamily
VLERCVSCLPRQTGRVFMMREWLGFETGEICARLGVSAENCRTILHRARMALRACMQRDWIETRARA